MITTPVKRPNPILYGFLALILLVAVTFACIASVINTHPVDAATSTGKMWLYQIWPDKSGGTLFWAGAPQGATNYRCTLIIRNQYTGKQFEVTTTDLQWINPNDLMFTYSFNFTGKSWVILGNDLIPTSGCEAWTNEWGDFVLLDMSYFLDYRPKIFLPILVR